MKNKHVMLLVAALGVATFGYTNAAVQDHGYAYHDVSPQATQAQCSICQDEVAENDPITITSCAHTFHKDCLATWFARQKSCPLCRKGVENVYENKQSAQIRLVQEALERADLPALQKMKREGVDLAVLHFGAYRQNFMHLVAKIRGLTVERLQEFSGLLGWEYPSIDGVATPCLVAQRLVQGADDWGKTPLHIALACGQAPIIIETFCAWGADPLHASLHGVVPYEYVSRGNSSDLEKITNCLLKHAIGRLFSAAEAGDERLFEIVIKIRMQLQMCLNTRRATLLHAALQSPRTSDAFIKNLLRTQVFSRAFRPFVNMRDANGNTPLHIACMCNRSDEVLMALRRAKADVFAVNNAGQMPRECLPEGRDKARSSLLQAERRAQHKRRRAETEEACLLDDDYSLEDNPPRFAKKNCADLDA